MKFVIIGGDAAGMSAASKTKRRDPGMDVTVLEKTRDVSYSACGMPYNIADPDRGMEVLVVRDAQTFIQKNGIDLLTGHTVESIDRGNRLVSGTTLDNRTFAFPYDVLLIATGASPSNPGFAGADLPGVFPLKSLEHGRRIKAHIDANPVKKAVIIGMGYIGLEMCEALAARSIAVDMIKPGPVLLPWMTTDLAGVVRQELDRNKIGVFMGHSISSIEKTDCGLRVTGNDISLDADMVILASGVSPNSELARNAGLETGISGAIAVDDRLVTSDPSIYAAGDCADAIHVVTGEKCWIPLALRANRAGWAVADNVCGTITRLQGVAGTAVFKVFDLQIARTGLSLKEARDSGFSPVEVTVKSRSRAHAHKGSSTIHLSMVGDKSTGRLLGVQMVGAEGVAHRINAPAVALHAGMTVESFFQSDLAYAPPFGPVWDPMLTTASQLLKQL
ncbi:MAG: FAD-dependent oxidoreductase [Pseudomonadota bacterium]